MAEEQLIKSSLWSGKNQGSIHKESIDPYCRGLSLKIRNALGILRRLVEGPRGAGHSLGPQGSTLRSTGVRKSQKEFLIFSKNPHFPDLSRISGSLGLQ